jgi:hypothetical protein
MLRWTIFFTRRPTQAQIQIKSIIVPMGKKGLKAFKSIINFSLAIEYIFVLIFCLSSSRRRSQDTTEELLHGD